MMLICSRLLYRLLQISSFNGKMNALNEVNKVISSVSYYTHRPGNPEEEEWLTAERMAVRTRSIHHSLIKYHMHHEAPDVLFIEKERRSSAVSCAPVDLTCA